MMKIGQWVHTKYMGKHDCVGYVTRLFPDFKRCKLRVTQCPKFPRMKYLEIGYEDVISVQEDYTKTELESLIDLSLATYDREWFEQLTSRCKKTGAV